MMRSALGMYCLASYAVGIAGRSVGRSLTADETEDNEKDRRGCGIFGVAALRASAGSRVFERVTDC